MPTALDSQMMMESIALFQATPCHSGVDRAIQHLAPELGRRAYRVDLLHVRVHGATFTDQREKIDIVSLGASRTYNSLPVWRVSGSSWGRPATSRLWRPPRPRWSINHYRQQPCAKPSKNPIRSVLPQTAICEPRYSTDRCKRSGIAPDICVITGLLLSRQEAHQERPVTTILVIASRTLGASTATTPSVSPTCTMMTVNFSFLTAVSLFYLSRKLMTPDSTRD
jgi:hypothetical protein